MDNIIDIYSKKKDYVIDVLNSDVIVSLKIDGKPFQVYYNKDTNEIEYHGRSGNSIKLGPKITKYDLLFSTGLNKGVKHFDKYKDEIKKYNFLCLEVSDGDDIYLLSVIDKDNNYINNDKELSKIAKSIGLTTMPIFFEGKLTDDMKVSIIDFIESEDKPKSKDFKKWIIDLFDLSNSDIKEINSLEEFEGIVLNFNYNGKETQYKIVDPVLSERRIEREASIKKDNEEHKEAYENAYKYLFEIATKFKGKYSKDHLDNLNEIFIKACDDDVKKMAEIGKTLITNTRYRYFIQREHLPKKLNKYIEDNEGLLNLYETYVKMFWKEKPRAFVISKEFQTNVNNFIKSIKEHKLISLKDYIAESLS